jgi:hypothetical protein
MDTQRNKCVVRTFAQPINERGWNEVDELVPGEFVRDSHAALGVTGRAELKQ